MDDDGQDSVLLAPYPVVIAASHPKCVSAGGEIGIGRLCGIPDLVPIAIETLETIGILVVGRSAVALLAEVTKRV